MNKPKHDYVVLPTTENPAYCKNGCGWIVLVVFIILTVVSIG